MDSESELSHKKRNSRLLGIILLAVGGLFLVLQLGALAVRSVVMPIERVVVRVEDQGASEQARAEADWQAEQQAWEAEWQTELQAWQAEWQQTQQEWEAERQAWEEEWHSESQVVVPPAPPVPPIPAVPAPPAPPAPHLFGGYSLMRDLLAGGLIVFGLYLLAKRSSPRMAPATSGPAADVPRE